MMKLFSPISARLTPKALSLSLIGFILLVCTLLILATAWQVVQSSNERVGVAKIAVSNIVLAAEQQARDTMLQADYILRDLLSVWRTTGWGPINRKGYRSSWLDR